ncbi:Stk1 family PASTA domain-containing Ser/Thr kinase [Glycomyces salinus]|uniref:Stk1 family PASTA domain-containing Ser/Thr kinase n=1 Tax=Glycomyces salinus TaxID=980294 RepID=UPI0018EE2349|nr:Stk1 family PASTA domain-containing Ser/Thr kinase [Glycomyces salinus]
MTTEPRLLGGRYEIGEVIGYGGMAEVHRGRDLRLGRDVAVKLLRSDLSRDESFLTRFRREATNSASLNHPNIVAVFDTGEEHGVPYMVMEFVGGRTLKEVLLAEGRFDYVTACEIVADMCSALDFSHKHHIIHRDVKPGNVMLSETNQVKVMDFGIARALASGQATMTQTSAVIGTAQYLSPEQARGEAVDARSDVYAAGCLLYELLVGHPPFTGDNPVSVAYQHVREDARPPSELNPNVPASVDAVVMRALAKNPDNRYRSAGDMREDLLRAARGEAVEAPMVMGADARTQIIGGGPDSTEPITPIEPRRSRKRPWLIALGIIAALALVGLGTFGIMRAITAPTMVAVPDVVGDPIEAAQEDVEAAGFEVEIEEETADSSEAEGLDSVTDQDPPGGQEEEQGSTVTLTVLRAPEQVSVPNVVGDQEDEATETLEGLNLEVEVEPQQSSAPEGQVLGQDPVDGEEVDPGTTVTLTVSGGGESQVPDVRDTLVDSAVNQLQEAGFEVEVQYDDGGSTVGVVYEQNPGAGSTEPDGTTVTITARGITVEWGAETTVGELQSTLEGEGLTVNVEGDDPEALVESVSNDDGAITSGNVVAPGSTVTITAAEDDGGGGGGDDETPTDDETPCTPPLCEDDG